MADPLISIATFQSVEKAEQAKAQLASAGIKALLLNPPRQSSPGTSIGLRVSESQAATAQAILAAPRLQLDDAPTYGSSAPPVHEERQPVKRVAPRLAERDAEEPEPNAREQNARRAAIAAVATLFFFPLWIYAVFVICKVWSSREPLGQRYRRFAVVAAIACAVWPAAVVFFLFMAVLGPLGLDRPQEFDPGRHLKQPAAWCGLWESRNNTAKGGVVIGKLALGTNGNFTYQQDAVDDWPAVKWAGSWGQQDWAIHLLIKQTDRPGDLGLRQWKLLDVTADSLSFQEPGSEAILRFRRMEP